ncbi:MAG: PAS domain-containing protein [Myxococcales bacterium]|nr:MAG: PAS domain-containing protein [Myxococcales bacterium]
MNSMEWSESVPVAVTVCDADGVIVYMNEKSAAAFTKYGGKALVGKNLLDCHPEPARTRLRELLAEPKVNAYTIEKNGVRKLIHQAPWYDGGAFAGLVELSIELPPELPHFVRK